MSFLEMAAGKAGLEGMIRDSVSDRSNLRWLLDIQMALSSRQCIIKAGIWESYLNWRFLFG